MRGRRRAPGHGRPPKKKKDPYREREGPHAWRWEGGSAKPEPVFQTGTTRSSKRRRRHRDGVTNDEAERPPAHTPKTGGLARSPTPVSIRAKAHIARE